MALEEGKDPFFRLNQSRPLPVKFLQIFFMFLVFGLGISIISMYMFRYFGIQNVPVALSKSNMIYPCFEEANDIDNLIKPPSNLMHKLNDTELLWRASFVPSLRKYPFKRTPKIAFMFLTKGPLPLAPLWERFFKGHEGLYSIYLHSFPAYVGDFTPSSVFYKRQIPSQLVQWGKMNMCDAERRLVANALLDISNEWFILLSESCIPLYNFSVTYTYIMKSRHSFVSAFDDPGPVGRGRYNESMAPEINITQWRKGAQWFEVNRKLAITIVEDSKYYPIFKEFCKPHCYVDEHYFPTMLTIQASNLIANRSLTWVDWSRGGSHPATFGGTDINDDFLRRVFQGRNCSYNNRQVSMCFLFARKFAPSSLEALLNIAAKVFKY
ncbi:Core-2/I-branching beta-1 6-N-acetylglucosaminyltransferase family protein [Euphorbia peplus]|nr:Core-2/I-branching beta-1 6-N-acetylglucosaminyltransferase family protein [Euphorbia peplus]